MPVQSIEKKLIRKKTEAGRSLKKETFPVLEMTCAACAISVESMLKSVEGVSEAQVNFAGHSVLVGYDPGLTNPEMLRQTVRSIGYDLVIETENTEEVVEAEKLKQYRRLKQKTIWAIFLSIPVVTIGMFFMDLPNANWIMMALATPVILIAGKNFFINAWKQARHRKANMDSLVALSTGIAWLFSAFNTVYPDFWHQRGIHAHVYFEAAAVIVAFILTGKLMEEKARSHTSSALRKLMGLQPKTVTLLLEEGTAVVNINAVKPGNIVLVKPGDKIPLDGEVTGGESYVDESMITGEPIPSAKKTGDKVFAGTINQKGSFYFRADKVGADTLLAQIIRMVQEAQGSKAPVQKLADRIAGVFVPVVLGLSLLTFILWMILGGDMAFIHALLTAITVLVIACPCALGLATPTAIMVGIGKGAENHILIKDAESLELAHRVNAIILDKTGTITEGRPRVSDMYFDGQADEKYLKAVLYSMESHSGHPLADAIIRKLEEENTVHVPMQTIESVTGKGIKANYEGKQFLAGNAGLMAQYSVEVSKAFQDKIKEWQDMARTVVYFSQGQNVVAIVAIADMIKPGSAAAIQAMQNAGSQVYMLTGDNHQTATAIAAQAGITDFRSEMLPADKADFVKELQLQGKVVAMVGDGINDSQALAQADVSIAMGKGSDIAMDVAKITLITSDLNSIPKALLLSRKTVRTIRQNLFWAFIYNLAGIPLAAGILYPINGFLLNPMIAGAAMALSSVSVVMNSLRLKTARLGNK